MRDQRLKNYVSVRQATDVPMVTQPIFTPPSPNAKNLWESRRRAPNGLAIVYGSDWAKLNSTDYIQGNFCKM